MCGPSSRKLPCPSNFNSYIATNLPQENIYGYDRMSIDFLTSIHEIVSDTLSPHPPFITPSLIKLYLSQCVTLLFLFRFTSSRKNQVGGLFTKLFEVVLLIVTHIGTFYIVSVKDSAYITDDIKLAMIIQVIIIYGLGIVDLVVQANGTEEFQQEGKADLEGTFCDPVWLKHLRHFNNDFLKIILSYNFIMINDLDTSMMLKLSEFAIKLYCLWIMLKYEYKSDEEEVERVVDVCEKV